MPVTAVYGDTMSTAKSGYWSAASTWTPATVPNNSAETTYDVTIPSSAFVTLDVSPTINSLALKGLLFAASGQSSKLTIVNGADVNGPVLFGGFFPYQPEPGQGSLMIGGDLNIGSSGYLVVHNGPVIVGDNLTNASSTVTQLYSDTGTDEFHVGGTLTNGQGSQIFLGAGRCFGPGCGIIGYAPNIAGGPVTTVGTLVNSGRVVSWSAITSASVTNNGLISLVESSSNFGTLKNAGELDISNSCCSQGQELTAGLSVGAPGSFVLGYSQSAKGVLDEVLTGSSTYGTINAGPWLVPNGIGHFVQQGYPVSLNGTLDIMLQNGFVPTIGEAFTIITTAPGDISGAFSNIVWDRFDNGLGGFAVSYDNTTGDVVITAEVVPEPGTLFLLLPAFPLILLGVRPAYAVLRRGKRTETRKSHPLAVTIRACGSGGLPTPGTIRSSGFSFGLEP